MTASSGKGLVAKGCCLWSDGKSTWLAMNETSPPTDIEGQTRQHKEGELIHGQFEVQYFQRLGDFAMGESIVVHPDSVRKTAASKIPAVRREEQQLPRSFIHLMLSLAHSTRRMRCCLSVKQASCWSTFWGSRDPGFGHPVCPRVRSSLSCILPWIIALRGTLGTNSILGLLWWTRSAGGVFCFSPVLLGISRQLRRDRRLWFLNISCLCSPSLISKSSIDLQLSLSLYIHSLFLHGWRIRSSLPEPLVPLRRDLDVRKSQSMSALDNPAPSIVVEGVLELPEGVSIEILA